MSIASHRKLRDLTLTQSPLDPMSKVSQPLLNHEAHCYAKGKRFTLSLVEVQKAKGKKL
jgi:hypothetical protein